MGVDGQKVNGSNDTGEKYPFKVFFIDREGRSFLLNEDQCMARGETHPNLGFLEDTEADGRRVQTCQLANSTNSILIVELEIGST
jgi:hypothetical protein